MWALLLLLVIGCQDAAAWTKRSSHVGSLSQWSSRSDQDRKKGSKSRKGKKGRNSWGSKKGSETIEGWRSWGGKEGSEGREGWGGREASEGKEGKEGWSSWGSREGSEGKEGKEGREGWAAAPWPAKQLKVGRYASKLSKFGKRRKDDKLKAWHKPRKQAECTVEVTSDTTTNAIQAFSDVSAARFCRCADATCLYAL